MMKKDLDIDNDIPKCIEEHFEKRAELQAKPLLFLKFKIKTPPTLELPEVHDHKLIPIYNQTFDEINKTLDAKNGLE